MTVYRKPATVVAAVAPSGKASTEEGSAPARRARVTRTTGETDIAIDLNLDGAGACDIETGVPFFDHMLNAFGRHGLFDLTVRAVGDTEVDAHHTVEDTGIVLGQAFAQALGDKADIGRFADAAIPMDETLVMAAVEFFYAFARDAGVTLHVRELAGGNSHHIIEAAFKAAGRAMRRACEHDPRVAGVPSTKGAL